ncbi:hypothetical protein F4823DRAFT_568570 [Ustulina deusta]|nr:hypothetical protein F4823DRAFT_568570 [Ustulina deusta]
MYPPREDHHSYRNKRSTFHIDGFENTSSYTSIVNLRNQLNHWTDRVQKVETAQAYLEDRFESLRGRRLRSRSQSRNLNARILYELFVGRIEELEKNLKNMQSKRNQHSEIGQITENEPDDIAKNTADIGMLNSATRGLEIQDHVAPWTQDGFIKFLRSIDFRLDSHLQLLCRLDSRDVSRDLSISCNITIPNPPEIDYILRSGPNASYIADHPACRSSRVKDMEELEEHDLKDLRVLRLSYYLKAADRTPNEEQEAERCLAEWKKTARPPRYVYDLGQLVLTGIGEDQENNNPFFPTKFNLVIDMISPQKPVWLFMRPEFEPVEPNKPDMDKTTKYITLPSQYHTGDHSRGLGNRTRTDLSSCVAARIAKKMTDINLTQRRLDYNPLQRYDGSEYGMKMLPNSDVRVRFVTPGYEEIMEAVGLGCAAAIEGSDEGY